MRARFASFTASDDDYEFECYGYDFECYGGESETKHFGHDLRRRNTMDLLPALRDAEGDLATWRRSPLRPLIESALSGVDRADVEAIKDTIEAATARLADFEAVGANSRSSSCSPWMRDACREPIPARGS